ncbi:MAG: bifunctional hydroxymethylpyrimidine kinase/phosphomethylpyrimidine kinase [Firmicutes bacterium]|nr:bifunctional hydroxymethylpyrimidine kinase/phosphomethylpyrimidine kinase [Bacillota bacterium]
MSKAIALTIAGSDSGGGAGIQTDLKTFAALNAYGTSVITALTAQNTKGVHGIHAVPHDFVKSQIDAVLSDIRVKAVKTGMLAEAAIIETVAERLRYYRMDKLVVDPVMVAESGDRLLEESAIEALRTKLIPQALIVTPNLAEAGELLGRQLETVDEMIAAARDLYSLGPRHVLVKGGHLPGEEKIDIFFDGKTIHRLAEKKIDTVHTHGTGCTYAAAITAYLAHGLAPLAAVQKAKVFITEAIKHGVAVGEGYGPTDPMGSLWEELNNYRAKCAGKD